MEEYISKEKVKGFVRSGISTDTEADKEYVCAFIDSIPPADVRPNIHGHWINHVEHCESIGAIPSGLGAYEWCSNCDCGIDVMEWQRNNYNYCPNCGADMRGKSCNTCKNSDDEFSGECYECVKGIFDHYEPKGEKGTE